MEQSQEETWRNFRKGRKEGFLKLYREHYLGLINYGIKFTGNRTTANECLGKMLLGLWENRDRLPEVLNVRSYLISCLKGTIYDHYRAENVRKLKEDRASLLNAAEGLTYTDYFDRVQNNEVLRERLSRAMQRLTPRQREILTLKFFQDLSYDEICDRLDISKRTAYNIVNDSLKIMRTEAFANNMQDFIGLSVAFLAIVHGISVFI